MDLLPHLRAVPTIPEIAEALLAAPPEVPWAHEGLCRHIVRRTLLLVRWTRSWRKADREARRLVANGRMQAKIRMPAGWDWLRDPRSWAGDHPECPIDGKWVPAPLRVDHVYCSEGCARRARYIREQLNLGVRGDRRCAWCSELLIDADPRAIYCCKQHQALAAHHRRRANELAELELQAEAAPRVCARLGCGTVIPYDALPKQRHCSNKCASATQKLRRKLATTPPRYCKWHGCGQLLPPEYNLKRLFCGHACKVKHDIWNAAVKRRANGHAPPNVTTMRLPDPPPIDPTLPEVIAAAMQIRSQIEVVRREEPDWTAHQIAREARRRCTPAVLAAIEAADGARRVRWLRVGPRR